MANQGSISLQNAQIVISDGAGTVVDTRNIPTITLAAVGFTSWAPQFVASNAGTAVTLPTGNIYFAYIRNLNAGGGADITITWTPRGGASNPVYRLQPGDAILVISTTNADANSGITAMTLTSSAGNSNAEVLLGG